jgi:hypothetical protein
LILAFSQIKPTQGTLGFLRRMIPKFKDLYPYASPWSPKWANAI